MSSYRGCHIAIVFFGLLEKENKNGEENPGDVYPFNLILIQ